MSDEEGRAFQQNRTALLGRLAATFFLVTAGARWLVLASMSEPDGWALRAGSLAFVGAAAALALVWAGCSRGRRSATWLHWIEATSVVLAGTTLASIGISRPAPVDDAYPIVANVALLIVARAVIVPSSAARTLWISLGAASPALLSVALRTGSDGWSHAFASHVAVDTLIQVFWLLATVGLSVLASRVTFGLRAEVREARQVGQYTLERKLGAGGMGVVYLARHSRLKRPTAVKLLSPTKVGEQAVARFEREVQITARLTHPNTVAVFDYGRTLDGVFYYAMEYLEGVSLEKLVAAEGPQPPGRVVRVLHQVAGALGEAHALGLVHRDIKPANIILCERGGVPDVAKVLDFGLVKDQFLPDAVSLTQSNVIVGTPLYMAPEAVSSPDHVGPRTDIYALGAVGYYLLTGEPVFLGKNMVEVLGHHLHTRPTPPSERLGRAVPAALEALVLSCLEKDPDQRPYCARAVQSTLEAAAMPRWAEADARARWAASLLLTASPEGSPPTARRLRPVGDSGPTGSFDADRR